MLGGAAVLALEATGRTHAGERTEALALQETEFRAFYERTARPLWAYLMRSCGDRELAEDLVQEAYYRLLRSDFETDSDEHRRNYLFRIGTNLLRDHFRRHRPTQLPLEEERAEAADEPPGREVGLRSDLARHLSKLRPRDRQLLWLAHVEGLSHREIARVMELEERSIRLMVFRARQRLAALLRESGIGPEVTR
ncbi:MAG: sigma-70 family RNA polymerase sigma factor [Thermoanaerobaculia bacterium]|nr:sigma-70 family RNA polymerase sigma factor [Thermoanaerobaculia bacterium]